MRSSIRGFFPGAPSLISIHKSDTGVLEILRTRDSQKNSQMAKKVVDIEKM